MKKSSYFILKFLFLIILVIPVFSGITSFAANITATDSDSIIVRKPDPQFAEKYLQQKEFVYSDPPVAKDILGKLLEPIMKWFRKWSSFSATIPMPLSLLIGSAIILLLFFIIYKTKLYRIFYPNREIELPDTKFLNGENLLEDYDREIQQQIEQRQYRNAIRLWFLKLITILRDKGLIHFSKDKTNYDYLRELTDENLKPMFRSVIFIYSHVWYGHTEIEEDQYLKFEKSFQSFYHAVDVQE